MKPVQRIVDIYKAQSQLSHQNSSNSNFDYNNSPRGQDTAGSSKNTNTSFDKVLREQIIKANSRNGN